MTARDESRSMALEPGLWRILAANPSPMTGDGTNTYVLGTGALAVIDPGPDDPAHLDAILGAVPSGGRITQIVVTHAHADHGALARALADRTGAPVLGFGPPAEGRSPQMARLAATGLAGGGEGVDATFAPDLRLRDGDRIEGPDWRLEVLHTPGHFAGHLCLAWGDRLFSGDHVMGWSTSLVSPPDGDMADYMASLARLADRQWSRLYPGHGDPVEDPASRIAALITHRRAREQAILDALADGPCTLDAVTARVYADTPVALQEAARRNALAHLLALCASGRATATPAPSPDATFCTTAQAKILPVGSGRPPRTLL